MMDVKSLSDIASFGVARFVWSTHINENKKLVCSKVRNMRSADQKSVDLEKHLNKVYPRLPVCIQCCILDAAAIIEKELLRWRNNIYNIVCNFDHVSWTPFFTIDKVKSSCKTQKFDIALDTLCACCFDAYVDNCRSNLSSRELNCLLGVFGNFVDHVILYWHWYGRQNRSLMTHVHKYYMHYEHSKPLENLFKLSVFIEYETAVFHYWKRMKVAQREKYRSLVIPLLVFESDYLEFVESNGLLPIHTFSFFWSQLDNYERFDVLQYYFLDFYRYLLYHENGLPLIFTILNAWKPNVAPIEYFKLLRLANDTNNLDLFELLWKKKLTTLSFESIGHLMWTLLLQKDEDFKLSVMMINDYDHERKVEVLNELDKRIECVHFDFNDRIDGFLTAASLEHLRVTGFPRNPTPRRERSRYRTVRRFQRRYY